MGFINNYKGYLIILLLTLVMGYFLGLMIATTVDYRLKNFIVNLPRPKNKIVVKLKEKDINIDKSTVKKKIKIKKKRKNNLKMKLRKILHLEWTYLMLKIKK